MTNRISFFLLLLTLLTISSCSKLDSTEKTTDIDLSLLPGTWTFRHSLFYDQNQLVAIGYFPPNTTFSFAPNGIYYEYTPDSTYQTPYVILNTSSDIVFSRQTTIGIFYDTTHITSLTSHELILHGRDWIHGFEERDTLRR